MENDSSNRGGSRPGAGRKPGGGLYGEPTTVLRVPASQAGPIRDFLFALTQKRQRDAQDNVLELTEFAPDSRKMSLPLYTSKVAAGFPSPADDHVERRLNPSDYLVDNDSSTFFVRVKGDSMIDAGIFEDDVLVIDRSRVPQIGDIVLAVLDGEFTVKTLGKSKGGARLLPANKHYPVIEVKEGQSFEVWGVVTGSMRKFK
jgi:DNA polymerase V